MPKSRTNPIYSHDQLGFVIVISLAILSLLLIISTIAYASNLSITITTILILSIALFYKLKVRVDNKLIHVIFGIGLIRKTFKLSDIKLVKAVENKWYYGWGIHLTPHGWLYNVSGYDAVELTMKNGRKARIGTNDSLNLVKIIKKNISSRI